MAVIDTQKKLIEYLQDKSPVYLYGAGRFASRMKGILLQHDIRISGFIVADMGGNFRQVDGLPVRTMEEMASCKNLEEIYVVVAVTGSPKQIVNDLLRYGFCNIVPFSERLRTSMNICKLRDSFNTCGGDYWMEVDYPYMEPSHVAMIHKPADRTFCRMAMYMGTDVLAATLANCKLEVYEAQYGDFRRLPVNFSDSLTSEAAKRERIEIYAVTSHLDAWNPAGGSEGVVPLQVGAALSNLRKGCATDDTGDQISALNRDYCECTGLYWIWKNTSGQRYVGLSHYRRRLALSDAGVEYMKKENLDVVTVLPQFLHIPLKEYFVKFLYAYDWELMEKYVLEADPSYRQVLDRYRDSYFFIPCNMAIFRREWFDRYCEFAFGIAGKISEEYRRRGITREDRYMGYIFENLLSLFLMRHRDVLRVACTDMIYG